MPPLWLRMFGKFEKVFIAFSVFERCASEVVP
jgi:hypothetical protein